MSRREMRAKGLLAPILDGASPLDDLTPTAEIRLKRLTRKEMREREAMEAHSAQSPSRSGSRPSDSPRSRSSDLTRSPEPTRRSDLSRSRSSDLTRAPEPTRRSSEGTRLGQSARAKAHAASGEPRWRHVEDDPAVVASFNEPRSDRKERASDSGVAMPSQLSSRAADVETPEHVDERLESGPFTHSLEPRRIADSSRRDAPEEPREPTRQSVFNRFEQDASQTSGVDLAGPEDLAAYPELVPGYIGPQVLGPQSSRRGDRPRYLLDPRIARGSRWVTGANQADTHVVDLVYGRDFEADGTIEAAEIRDGDQAPDGSGPLRLARGVEIGHIFQLGRKYAQALGLTVLDRDGRSVVVTMGSYGIGVTRVLAALAEANHDDRGLAWPVGIAPADVHILATGRDDAVFDAAGRIARDVEAAGVDVLYDDRRKVSAGVKFADYELLGMPWGVVVGRGLAEGRVEIRNRRTGERTDVPVEQAPARLRSLIADE